uniref:Uncharacterized protein n=1 Tax=Glossina austeni TaxID=7395 RepID=A0A1A9UL59_GLOAU
MPRRNKIAINSVFSSVWVYLSVQSYSSIAMNAKRLCSFEKIIEAQYSIKAIRSYDNYTKQNVCVGNGHLIDKFIQNCVWADWLTVNVEMYFLLQNFIRACEKYEE